MIKRYIVFIAFLFSCGSQASNLPNFPFVVSTGLAEKEVSPNIAEVQIDLMSFNVESNKAMEGLNMASSAVIELLKKYKIDVKQLEASDIQKSTKRADDGNYNKTQILGYEISRNMTLKLEDLSYYAELMSELAAIDNLTNMRTHFDVSNRKLIESDLIQEASTNAENKAKRMASSLGSKVHSVYAVSQASDFGDFFATFGAQTYNAQYLNRTRFSPVIMFVPKSINISQHINVVFQLEGNR